MPQHARDIADADLELMLRRCAHPAELRILVDRARATIGFFPAHNPRALEYPWILANLPHDLHGLRILDVGAGVNPLPFVLADRGASVITLDAHAVTRTIADRAEWNEWGFLDYAAIDARIHSVRSTYEDARFAKPFDAIFSVSAIEHIPGANRRIWIDQFARHIRVGGVLLLTVDLVPNSDALWNRAEGSVVEATYVHGEFATLLEELDRAGFTIEATDIQRAIADSPVDVGFVSARRRA
jgi:2-polyprenyl-3-methyl-5-hydroxy-6-metoxy-1,4-benzoquinol methylase